MATLDFFENLKKDLEANNQLKKQLVDVQERLEKVERTLEIFQSRTTQNPAEKKQKSSFVSDYSLPKPYCL